ncbi:MAG: Holliday junction branch migration protein RuvA [Cellvibrionaceae bacterium]
MIGRLKGIIIEKQPPHVLVDVTGVGYEVQAPMTSFYPMPAVGEEVILHTHLSISENAHQLFAFYTQDERKLFRTLIKVSGVGPKMALAILSGMPAAEFVQCVRADNVTALVKVPGVGKKTAERLIIEVKDRLKDWGAVTTEGISPPDLIVNQSLSSVTADAESALIALGYRPTEAAKVIASVQKEQSPDNSEELIRLALKSLAG